MLGAVNWLRMVALLDLELCLEMCLSMFNKAGGGGDLIHSVYGMGYKVE